MHSGNRIAAIDTLLLYPSWTVLPGHTIRQLPAQEASFDRLLSYDGRDKALCDTMNSD